MKDNAFLSLALRFAFGLLALLNLIGSAAAIDHVIIDFERGKLSDQWRASSGLTLQRTPIEPLDVNQQGPSGQALWVKPSKAGSFSSRGSAFELKALPQSEELSFWVYAPQPSGDPPPAILFDLVFTESDLKAAFWRKVDFVIKVGSKYVFRWLGFVGNAGGYRNGARSHRSVFD